MYVGVYAYSAHTNYVKKNRKNIYFCSHNKEVT